MRQVRDMVQMELELKENSSDASEDGANAFNGTLVQDQLALLSECLLDLSKGILGGIRMKILADKSGMSAFSDVRLGCPGGLHWCADARAEHNVKVLLELYDRTLAKGFDTDGAKKRPLTPCGISWIC